MFQLWNPSNKNILKQDSASGLCILDDGSIPFTLPSACVLAMEEMCTFWKSVNWISSPALIVLFSRHVFTSRRKTTHEWLYCSLANRIHRIMQYLQIFKQGQENHAHLYIQRLCNLTNWWPRICSIPFSWNECGFLSQKGKSHWNIATKRWVCALNSRC